MIGFLMCVSQHIKYFSGLSVSILIEFGIFIMIFNMEMNEDQPTELRKKDYLFSVL